MSVINISLLEIIAGEKWVACWRERSGYKLHSTRTIQLMNVGKLHNRNIAGIILHAKRYSLHAARSKIQPTCPLIIIILEVTPV